MTSCPCTVRHVPRRVVLTGGPGAGKTAVLELARRSLCEHVHVLPEAAGIVFGGGFPRNGGAGVHRAAQRAIYHVQRELESLADDANAAVVLCDRGTVDGGAYWPGPGDLWTSVGSTLREELARYDSVIHLKTPNSRAWYSRQNPLRQESLAEAAAIDARIEELWAAHPRRFVVDASRRFLDKAAQTLEILLDEVPECCRRNGSVPRKTSGRREAVGGPA